jgi:NAD+ synthase (glutamine-hydrolysing)
MRLIRIGLANLDPTVGALESNIARLIARAHELADRKCTIACFPEQAISGYPAEDCVQWRTFVAAQWRALARFAAETASARTVFVLGLTVEDTGSLYNCAAVVCGGEVLGVVPKEKLPTYGVFYEARTLSAGIPYRVTAVQGTPFGDLVFRFRFGTIAVEICEDIWSPDGPMRRRAYAGAELVVNISASPFRSGIVETRREMISTRAADNAAAVVYVNQVGGNDSLVFDGGGYVNEGGRMLFEAPRWREGVSTVDVDLDRVARQRRENTTWRVDRETHLRAGREVRTVERADGPDANDPEYRFPTPSSRSFFIPPEPDGRGARRAYFEDLILAMETGLDGYFRKTGAFTRVAIALSGGKDSGLTLLLTHDYFRRRGVERLDEVIHCVSLPTRFNSDQTRSIARELCAALGVSFREVPIEKQVEAQAQLAREMSGADGPLPPMAAQNVQARVRGAAMWNWTNAVPGTMWLQTGNMSEKAVGYTTVGGDLMGAYSLIGNLPKSVVSELLRFMYDTMPAYRLPALERLIASRPSAELAPDQEDEKDLMPFAVLDTCYALFAGEKMSPSEVLRVVRTMWSDEELAAMHAGYRPGLLDEWVRRFVRLFRASIFKWVQAPQTVHLGGLDLDRERALQLPVVQSPEWLDE